MGTAVTMFFLTMPAGAWEFTPRPVCTLSDETDAGRVVVTFDPSLSEPYAISITGATPWPDTPVFSMRFDGPRGLTISTDRQTLSDGGRTLTVTDRGFGNVLNGLEFNNMATALAGDVTLPFPLAGAAPEVQAFRACTAGPTT